MPKPFGKVARRRLGLSRPVRLAIALWIVAIPAYLLCRGAAMGYPTLAKNPFFWPAAVAFGLFYATAIALWLRHRPSPRPPWESSRLRILAKASLVALLVAAPTGFASAFLYEPALEFANGILSISDRTEEYAIVARAGQKPIEDAELKSKDLVLESPYWEHGFHWPLADSSPPPDLTVGSPARLVVRRGLLGARWVVHIEFAVLR